LKKCDSISKIPPPSPPGGLWGVSVAREEGAEPGREGLAGESPARPAEGQGQRRRRRRGQGERRRGQGEGASRGESAAAAAGRRPRGRLRADPERPGEAALGPGGGVPPAGDRGGRAGQRLGHQAAHQGRPGAGQQAGERCLNVYPTRLTGSLYFTSV